MLESLSDSERDDVANVDSGWAGGDMEGRNSRRLKELLPTKVGLFCS